MKILHLEIKNCSECPYVQYDPNYGMSYNSGWDCSEGGFRIKNDVGSGIVDISKLPIPSECPLKDQSEIRDEILNKILKK